VINPAEVPAVDGIDLDFTPRNYFTARDLHVALPSDIMGKVRRDLVRHRLAEGEKVPPELALPVLCPEIRDALGKLHPMLMGGEYLPPMRDGEVEIARISLQSVTADQISVRARRTASGIAYSVVDEYYCDHSFTVRPRTSREPLSMRRLVAMVDGACDDGGAAMSPIVAHVANGGSPEEYRDFVAVESDFYPDLGRYYDARIEQLVAQSATPWKRCT
jgi:hypothetical protein